MKKKYFKRIVITTVTIALVYLISVTIVNAYLMGLATPDYSWSTEKEQFLISDSTRIDSQTDFKCSAFSSAYILRHWGKEAQGDSIYEIMPNKMEDGYVYPKGIISNVNKNGTVIDTVPFCAVPLRALRHKFNHQALTRSM